jgi:regulation of enolase protein 1 (concanavalin A-like superfamily)
MQTLIGAVPMPLWWDVPPVSCRTDNEESLTVVAPGGTDLFADPTGGQPALNAPRLLGTPPTGDFRLSAQVTVDFVETYDAGVLLVWAGETSWAKLCFERSPQGTPMVVSVVTRGASDDANAFTVAAGEPLWLRICRLGRAWAFHASTDGSSWQFVRYFSLDRPSDGQVTSDDADAARVGFEAQSPLGSGCRVSFKEIAFSAGGLIDLRSGE